MSTNDYIESVGNKIVESHYNINGNAYHLSLPLLEKEALDELITLIELREDPTQKNDQKFLAEEILKAVQLHATDTSSGQSLTNNAKAALASLIEFFPQWGIEMGNKLSKYL